MGAGAGALGADAAGAARLGGGGGAAAGGTDRRAALVRLRTDWRTLYADLDPDDARQTGQILAQAQIPFEPTADGAGIRVPAAQLDKARLATAAKGG